MKKVKYLKDLRLKLYARYDIHVHLLENRHQKEVGNSDLLKYYDTGISLRIIWNNCEDEKIAYVYGIDGLIGFLEGLTFLEEFKKKA